MVPIQKGDSFGPDCFFSYFHSVKFSYFWLIFGLYGLTRRVYSGRPQGSGRGFGSGFFSSVPSRRLVLAAWGKRVRNRGLKRRLPGNPAAAAESVSLAASGMVLRSYACVRRTQDLFAARITSRSAGIR